MKDVELKLDYPPLKPELRKFVDWVSDYTLSPRGMVLRMCLRMGEHLGPAREKVGVRLAGPPPKRMTAARARVLQLLADGMVRTKSEAAHEAGVSAGVIDGLVDEGALETLVLPPEPVARPPDPDHDVPEFTDAQRAAADALRATVAKGGFSVTLVDGVTGSGKTEVYFEAVAEAIRRNKQVLILMPEIALTAQFLDRFAERFGVRPAEWHSELAPRKRARTWAAVAAGEVSVVVGARSALFLPYADLGLIVVDEEHDPAYKQEDGVRYHARDMAVVRARETKIPIVLASATPSVETVVNARRGRYAHLHLPERFGGQHLPSVEADRSAPRRAAARPLHLAAAGRSGEDRARARRAGAAVPQPPRLRAADAVQRLRPPAWRARTATPGWSIIASSGGWSAITAATRCRRRSNARNARRRAASSRSVPASSGWSRRRPSCFPARASWCCPAIWSTSMERLRQELDDVAQGRFDIVIGTQLVAKGHHFPKLNLVGIVDADLGLANGDPRAAERTFQLLHQVVGRAGREEGRGYGYPANAPARASGDARADRAGPRGVLRRRDRGAREDRLSAVRPAGEPADLRRRQARHRSACAQARGGRADPRAGARARARPKRRSRWCAAAIASACW